MKKFILKNYYQFRVTIIEIRLFFLKNDLEFLESADWETSRTWKKILALSAKGISYQIKIQEL